VNPVAVPPPNYPPPNYPPPNYRPPNYPPPPYLPPRSAGRPLWLLAAAGLWSAGLIAASFSVRPSLIQVNGPKVLLPVSAPLAIVALVALGLTVARRRSARWATVVSWVLAGLLDCLALVGMLTIGVFILPVAIAVTAACAMG
jgi:hypothetical protein